eukprot:7305944-Pyramimonas_sp.AAC.1
MGANLGSEPMHGSTHAVALGISRACVCSCYLPDQSKPIEDFKTTLEEVDRLWRQCKHTGCGAFILGGDFN